MDKLLKRNYKDIIPGSVNFTYSGPQQHIPIDFIRDQINQVIREHSGKEISTGHQSDEMELKWMIREYGKIMFELGAK